MRLNKNKIYDLSELTSEEKGVLLKHMKEVHGWCGNNIHTDLYFSSEDGWLYNMVNKVTDMTNAKELFYTLENVQVDCRYLTEEQIKKMADVYKNNGFRIGSLYLCDDFYFLRNNYDNYCMVNQYQKNKNTITYEKFMELFSRKEENFKKLVEVLNEELTEEAYKETEYEVKYIAEKPKQYQIGIDTFERCEANMTKEEILACVKFGIDKYTWRNKGQDLEDLEKIISYANWGIKQLKQQ